MGSPVLLGLRQLALDHWEKLFVKPCPLCRRSLGSPGAPGAICQDCRKHLDLPTDGFQGLDPLPWWGAGPYRAGLRGLVLDLKRQPCRQSVAALVATMTPSLHCQGGRPSAGAYSQLEKAWQPITASSLPRASSPTRP